MNAAKRRVAAMVVVMIVCAPLALDTRAASAFPPDHTVIPFTFHIDATTTIKKLDQTITIKGGTFKGAIDLVNGALIGSITLPPASFTYRVAGVVPVVTATAAIVPTKFVGGRVDFLNFTVTATATFNVRIIKATAPGVPVNLVGNSCITETPVSVTMGGAITTPSTFTGVYTLPNLKNCGVSTTALNLLLPGPGNTFSATAT